MEKEKQTFFQADRDIAIVIVNNRSRSGGVPFYPFGIDGSLALLTRHMANE